MSVEEAVVEDLDISVLLGEHDNLVGNGLGIGETRDVLANTLERELDLVGTTTLELSLALLANDDQVEVLALTVHATNGSAHAGVNTTAETLVGRADDDEGGLVLLGFGNGSLGGNVDLVGGLTVGTGLGHGALGSGELGGGDNLHGVGDLFDVSNGLETAFDFTEGRVAGGAGGSSSEKKEGLVSS